MDKFLVTGGAGFIGSHIVDRLVEDGHKVIVVDNLSTGFCENINPKAKYYCIDISNKNELRIIFDLEEPNIVIHEAAQMDVRKSTRDPIFDAEQNIIGSLNLIMHSIDFGVKKIIYASTGGAVYGDPDPKDLPVGEDYPINPISQYGVSKHTVEHYLRLYSQMCDLKYIILRYPNVYGPRQFPYGSAGVVSIFIQKILDGHRPIIFGDGSKTRDYVFVSDIVEANILALTKGDNSAYNLGTGEEVSVSEIFRLIKTILKSDLDPIYREERLGEVKRICLDATKAKKELGWDPRMGLAEGVLLTIQDLRKRGN